MPPSDPNAPAGGANPYAPPLADIASNQLTDADLGKDDLVLFVGPRSAYYLRKWSGALRTGGFSAGFNWPAALLSFVWFFYRKMFRESALLLAGVAAIGAIEAGAEMALGSELRGLDRIVNICIMVATGVLANGLYLRRAKRVIADVHRKEPDPKQRAQLLMSRGGTSAVWAVVAVLILLGLAVLGALAERIEG